MERIIMPMYRYKQSYGELYVLEFEVIRVTLAGKWIKPPDVFPVKDYFGEKFIKNVGKKRFAYEAKEDALTNFIKRTERHIMLMEGNIIGAKEALGKAIKLQSPDE